MIVAKLDLIVACFVSSFWWLGSINNFSVFLQVEIICLSFPILFIANDFLGIFRRSVGLGVCEIDFIVVSWAVCMILWIAVSSSVEFLIYFCRISFGVSSSSFCVFCGSDFSRFARDVNALVISIGCKSRDLNVSMNLHLLHGREQA